MDVNQIIIDLKEWFYQDGLNCALKLVYSIAILVTGRIAAGLLKKL